MKSNKVNGGTAAACSSAAPLSHYNDQGVRERWPALVYRLQSHRGWEVYSDPDLEKSISTAKKKINATSTSTKTKGSSDGGNSANNSINNNNSGDVEELTVAPALGCIEVRKMRLRLHLKHTKNNNNNPAQNNGPGGISKAENGKKKQQTFEQQSSNSTKGVNNDNNEEEVGEEYDSDTPGSDGWNNNPLLVRRRNSLLVSVRRGYGVIMFQFKSTHDCMEFCDRLVYLNRDLLSPSSTTTAAAAAAAANSNDILLQGQVVGTSSSSSSSLIGNNRRFVNGMDKRESYMESMRENKRHRTSTFGDTLDQNNNHGRNHRRNASEGNDDNVLDNGPPSIKMYEVKKQCQRREDIMSYVAKLAHSEEFLGFVEELERGLEGSQDTAAIHAAFGL